VGFDVKQAITKGSGAQRAFSSPKKTSFEAGPAISRKKITTQRQLYIEMKMLAVGWGGVQAVLLLGMLLPEASATELNSDHVATLDEAPVVALGAPAGAVGHSACKHLPHEKKMQL